MLNFCPLVLVLSRKKVADCRSPPFSFLFSQGQCRRRKEEAWRKCKEKKEGRRRIAQIKLLGLPSLPFSLDGIYTVYGKVSSSSRVCSVRQKGERGRKRLNILAGKEEEKSSGGKCISGSTGGTGHRRPPKLQSFRNLRSFRSPYLPPWPAVHGTIGLVDFLLSLSLLCFFLPSVWCQCAVNPRFLPRRFLE